MTVTSRDEWADLTRYWVQRWMADPKNTFHDLHFHHRWSSARWFTNILDEVGVGQMARGKKPVTQAQNSKGTSWTTFVEISLAGHDMDKLLEAYRDIDAVYDAMADLLANGYRLSIVYNPQNDAFIASLTCRDEASPNSGKTFNAFADNWYDAIRVVLVKHFVIAKQVWSSTGRDSSNRPKYG